MKKVAVLGAGVMGSTIAAHLVNAGLEVKLLDLEIEDAGKKVNLAEGAVKVMKKTNPSPIYVRSWLSKIQTGTFQNDMAMIADCDWVVEVVKEDIEVKKKFIDLKPTTVLYLSTKGRKSIVEYASNLSSVLQNMLTDKGNIDI